MTSSHRAEASPILRLYLLPFKLLPAIVDEAQDLGYEAFLLIYSLARVNPGGELLPQLGSNSLLIPQGHIPPQVQTRPAVRFGIADLVVRLQQKRRGQQTGRHSGTSVVESVECGQLCVSLLEGG